MIVVASSAFYALGFDAGGKERQYDLWVPDLSEDEAAELLMEMDPDMRRQLVGSIGRNAGRLTGVLTNLALGVSVNQALVDNDKTCDAEVNCFLTIAMKDGDSNNCKVGEDIITALLHSQADGVDQLAWDEKRIFAKAIAKEIRDSDAHAVFFHTVKKQWMFASPAHRRAAHRRAAHQLSGQARS